MVEPTIEQKVLTINALTRIKGLITRGMFSGADAQEVFSALSFISQNIALMEGPSLVPPASEDQKVEQ